MQRHALFISCLTISVLYQLPAQIIVPDFPQDNYSGLFLESPMTLQPELFLDDSAAIVGTKVEYDQQSQTWGDTTLKLEQNYQTVGAQKIYTQRTFIQGGNGHWEKDKQTKVYVHEQGLVPDSVIFSSWLPGMNDWAPDKKIVYENPSPDSIFRSVYLGNQTQADTLEQYYNDWVELLTYRKRYYKDQSVSDLLLRDSTVYLYIDNLCRVMIRYFCENDTCTFARRFNFTYYGDSLNFTLREQHWSNDVNFWVGKYLYHNIFLPDEKRIIYAYDTLTNVAFQNYFRIIKQFDANWQPNYKELRYYPSLFSIPDSSNKRNYILFPVNNNMILEMADSSRNYLDDWYPSAHWYFHTTQLVSSGFVPDEKPDYDLYTLGNGQFKIELKLNAPANGYYRIADVSGRIFASSAFSANVLMFDLSKYPKGIYYASIWLPEKRYRTLVPLGNF